MRSSSIYTHFISSQSVENVQLYNDLLVCALQQVEEKIHLPTYLPSRGTRVWTLDGHGSESMSLGNVTLDTGEDDDVDDDGNGGAGCGAVHAG